MDNFKRTKHAYLTQYFGTSITVDMEFFQKGVKRFLWES